MGLLKKEGNKNIYDGFEEWLNSCLSEELPEGIAAVNFNLYEDGNNKWSAEIVGTESFDEEDDDWACDEIFDTRENPYAITCKGNWEDVLNIFKQCIQNYMEKGEYAEKLKKYEAVALGFTDGDLDIIYKRG